MATVRGSGDGARRAAVESEGECGHGRGDRHRLHLVAEPGRDRGVRDRPAAGGDGRRQLGDVRIAQGAGEDNQIGAARLPVDIDIAGAEGEFQRGLHDGAGGCGAGDAGGGDAVECQRERRHRGRHRHRLHFVSRADGRRRMGNRARPARHGGRQLGHVRVGQFPVKFAV